MLLIRPSVPFSPLERGEGKMGDALQYCLEGCGSESLPAAYSLLPIASFVTLPTDARDRCCESGCTRKSPFPSHGDNNVVRLLGREAGRPQTSTRGLGDSAGLNNRAAVPGPAVAGSVLLRGDEIGEYSALISGACSFRQSFAKAMRTSRSLTQSSPPISP